VRRHERIQPAELSVSQPAPPRAARAPNPLRKEHFARIDENDDALFYAAPKLSPGDESQTRAVARVFRPHLAEARCVLDLLAGAHSTLPEGIAFTAVAGLGLNAAELEANDRLTSRVVQDLNADPVLPFADRVFDACILTHAVEYLIKPVAVFAEIARVLKPGGTCLVAFARTAAPTKAIAIWRNHGDGDRARLVELYFSLSGGFGDAETVAVGDPEDPRTRATIVYVAKKGD
jgi:SAM-dependent methyltransferase